MGKELNSEYWNNRYKEENIPWDVGSITEPLKNYFDALGTSNPKILIPGCGNAHEAQYLHNRGFTNVYVCDWAEAALEKFRSRVHGFPRERLICGDFFEIKERFDLIIEQTFFCALDPSLRKRYVVKMNSLLNYRGKLVGLLFNTQFPKSPPYGGNIEEYKKLFAPFFSIERMEPCEDSIHPRLGSELFIELVKA